MLILPITEDEEAALFVKLQWKETMPIPIVTSASMVGTAKLSAQSTKRRVRQWWIHLKGRNYNQLHI